MKKGLAIVAFLVLVGVLVGLAVCPGIRSWENAEFTVKEQSLKASVHMR